MSNGMKVELLFEEVENKSDRFLGWWKPPIQTSAELLPSASVLLPSTLVGGYPQVEHAF